MTDNENGNGKKFEPTDHLITLKFTNKDGREVETKMLKGTGAMGWFYSEHPLGEGRIITECVQVDPPVFRAEVWINDVKVATGHANIEKNCNTFKRVETVAIRRALANAGYSAEAVTKRIAKEIGVDASKAMLGSGKANGERKLGGTETGGYKLPELYNAVLKDVFGNDTASMKAYISNLIELGKLPPVLTLNQAVEIVKNRHTEEVMSQV